MASSASSEPGSEQVPNAGLPFDGAWIGSARTDGAAVARRAARYEGAAADAGEAAAERLLQALGCIDLTTLADDDTEERVQALCARALQPLPDDVRRAHPAGAGVRVAAVCVYPRFVPAAIAACRPSRMRVCTVAAGFPDGGGTLEERVAQVRAARAAEADEIDVVIRRDLARAGAWETVYAEVRAFREACGPVPMKVILGTGELGALDTMACASRVALLAGADFIKTSTGKEAVNATLPAGLVMARAIRDYAERSGHRAGLKPAGGISTPEQALAWLALVESELGPDWSGPERFRFGASGLLDNLVRRLGELA